MLNIMRENATSWIIKLLLALIVIVFIFLGIGTMNSQRPNNAAVVNGTPISYESYASAVRNLRNRYEQQLGSQVNADFLRMLNIERQAMDGLIDRTLMQEAADEMGIQVTDAELSAKIVKIPAFQTDGAFDSAKYRSLLARNRYTVEDFESDQRQQLLFEKLQDMITATPKVTEEEARTWYRWDQATVDLEYAVFSPSDFMDATVSDEAVASYYDTHKEAYKTEPKVKLDYIAIHMPDYREQVQITDEDVSTYYSERTSEWAAPKTVHARHILIRVDAGADDTAVEEARARIEGVRKEIQEGADFAEMARKHSEGPTAPTGGDLGEFRKESMVKPFADKAFSMAAGEVSEPVRTRFGWHLIKVEGVNEAHTKTLEEVRDQIRDSLVGERYKNLAYDAVDTIYNATLKGDDLTQAAALLKMEVQSSDWLTASHPNLEIENAAMVADAGLALEPGEISEILEADNWFYLVECMEKQASEIPPLETVIERVRVDALAHECDSRAAKSAEELLEALKTAADPDALLSDRSVKMEPVEKIRRNASLPGIGYKQAVSDALFELNAGSPFPKEAYKGSGGYYVFRFKNKDVPDDSVFEVNRVQTLNTLKQKKEQQFLTDWLKKRRENAQIDIQIDLSQGSGM